MLTTRFICASDCLNIGGARRELAHAESSRTSSPSNSVVKRSNIYLLTGKRYRCVETVCRARKNTEGDENADRYSGRDFILRWLLRNREKVQNHFI
jgi:hypothetical protein